MTTRQLNGRFQQKHDVEANWIKAVNFIPRAGELIVYDADDNYPYPRMKSGDGKTPVNDLPFSQGVTTKAIDLSSGEIEFLSGTKAVEKVDGEIEMLF